MLRIQDIPISGPSYVSENNMSVVHNTSRPETVLKKEQFTLLSCSP